MPQITNAAAATVGKTLLFAETAETITGGLVPANDDVQVGLLRRKRVTLTNAQIKALPTTPVTLVAAPGAGFRIKALSGTLLLDSVAGVYTNINAAYASLVLAHEDATQYWVAAGPVNDNSFTTPLADLSVFLNNGHAEAIVYDLVQPTLAAIQAAASGDRLWVVQSNMGGPAKSGVNNLPVVISADNNGSGAFTGGHAANTLKVTIYYVIEPL